MSDWDRPHLLCPVFSKPRGERMSSSCSIQSSGSQWALDMGKRT